MKLLLDQNLSPTLKTLLSDAFETLEHVRDVGMESASDAELWRHAAATGFTIVSKDADFRQLSFLRGHPPKVVWLRVGNSSTREIAAILKESKTLIGELHEDESAALLVIP